MGVGERRINCENPSDRNPDDVAIILFQLDVPFLLVEAARRKDIVKGVSGRIHQRSDFADGHVEKSTNRSQHRVPAKVDSMDTPLIALLLVTIPFRAAFTQPPEDLKSRFDGAERRIVRLPPTAFPELPGSVVRELQRRGCTIPQTPYTKKPHNVIKGEFAKPGQTDWAVLCSVKSISTILVFWKGSETNPAAIAPMEDRNYLQTINTADPGYSDRKSTR